jgi:hypothetical protein
MVLVAGGLVVGAGYGDVSGGASEVRMAGYSGASEMRVVSVDQVDELAVTMLSK